MINTWHGRGIGTCHRGSMAYEEGGPHRWMPSQTARGQTKGPLHHHQLLQVLIGTAGLEVLISVFKYSLFH